MKYTSEDFKRVFTGREPGIQGVRRQYAVLVPLVDLEQEAHILYELRSPYIDRQPGEVCFPGGELEPDETPLEAALRETREETGLLLPPERIIARLDTLHPASDIALYPFLGVLEPGMLGHMQLNDREVAECFTVPVSFLTQEPYIYRHFVSQEPGSGFRYDKIGLKEQRYNWRSMEHEIISWEYGGRFIWGLTAAITRHTLRILEGTVC